jgi:hypothetical protein
MLNLPRRAPISAPSGTGRRHPAAGGSARRGEGRAVGRRRPRQWVSSSSRVRWTMVQSTDVCPASSAARARKRFLAPRAAICATIRQSSSRSGAGRRHTAAGCGVGSGGGGHVVGQQKRPRRASWRRDASRPLCTQAVAVHALWGGGAKPCGWASVLSRCARTPGPRQPSRVCRLQAQRARLCHSKFACAMRRTEACVPWPQTPLRETVGGGAKEYRPVDSSTTAISSRGDSPPKTSTAAISSQKPGAAANGRAIAATDGDLRPPASGGGGGGGGLKLRLPPNLRHRPEVDLAASSKITCSHCRAGRRPAPPAVVPSLQRAPPPQPHSRCIAWARASTASRPAAKHQSERRQVGGGTRDGPDAAVPAAGSGVKEVLSRGTAGRVPDKLLAHFKSGARAGLFVLATASVVAKAAPAG